VTVNCVPALNTGHIILFTRKIAWNINVCSFLEQNFMYGACVLYTPLSVIFYVEKVYFTPPPPKIK
jgi:hypothetical protein